MGQLAPKSTQLTSLHPAWVASHSCLSQRLRRLQRGCYLLQSEVFFLSENFQVDPISVQERPFTFSPYFNDSWLGPLSAIAHMKQFSLMLVIQSSQLYLFIWGGGEGSTQRDQVYLIMWVLRMEHRSSGLAARNLGHLFVYSFKIY